MLRIKESTTVAEIIRQALDLTQYKLNRGLKPQEILGYRSTGGTRVILRGNTCLERNGWAILTGSLGDWQVSLNHNRFVRGTPKHVALSSHSKMLLTAIPEENGLFRFDGYDAHEVTDIEQITPSIRA